MAANDYSHLRTKTADHTIDTNYQQIMDSFKDESTWFQPKGNIVNLQELANEIVRLEYLQSQGHIEYTTEETVTKIHPIGPRLRELHKQLEATGKGPIPQGPLRTEITVVDGVDGLTPDMLRVP